MGVEVLLTNLSSSLLQSAETRKLVDLLTQKKLAFELVDGSAVESRDRRNEMWEKSGKRSYPQVFLNGQFFGDLDTIQVCATP
jgi:glutaredoxin